MTDIVMPFCDVEKIDNYVEGSMVDFGYCINERVTSQIGNENYDLVNLVLEPNTDTLIIKPEMTWRTDNGLTNWSVVSGSYWSEVTVPGFPQDRKMMKWALADPSTTYSIASSFDITSGEGFILELGLLPSANISTEPEVTFTIGGTIKLVVGKRSDPVLSIYQNSAWKEIAKIPLNSKVNWKDVNTELIWVIPYMGGVLIGTSADSLTWVYPPNGFSFTTGAIEISGKGGVAVFGAHTVSYTAASITSEDIDIGYLPNNTAVVTLRGWLEDQGVDCVTNKTWTLQHDTTYQYQVSIDPGNQLVGLKRVEISYLPDLIVSSGESTWVYDVQEVNEQIPEDPTEETCEISIDNVDLVHSGEFKKFDTVKWHFGWAYDDASIASYQRNYGFVTDINDQRSESADPLIELRCRPPVYRLMQGTVLSAPNYADWTVANMLGDFLTRHGVPPENQAIDASYTQVLPDAGDDSWEPKLGDAVRKWVEDIVYHTVGGWIYSGRDGKIHIEPYLEVDDAGIVWSGALPIYPHQLAELSYVDPEESIDDFRNIFLVQGMNPDGYPLAAAYRDDDSLIDPTSERFTGYPIPYTTAHKGYCTQEFVDATLAAVVARYNVKRKIIKFTTNERSGSAVLFPGSLTQVVRSGNESDWVLVRSVSSAMSHGKFQQIVYGHYIRRTTV